MDILFNNEFEDPYATKGTPEKIEADCHIIFATLSNAGLDFGTKEEAGCFRFEFEALAPYGDITVMIKYIEATGEMILSHNFPIAVPEDKTKDICILLNTINSKTKYSRCFLDNNHKIRCQSVLQGTEFTEIDYVICDFMNDGIDVYVNNYKAITSIIFS